MAGNWSETLIVVFSLDDIFKLSRVTLHRAIRIILTIHYSETDAELHPGQVPTLPCGIAIGVPESI